MHKGALRTLAGQLDKEAGSFSKADLDALAEQLAALGRDGTHGMVLTTATLWNHLSKLPQRSRPKALRDLGGELNYGLFQRFAVTAWTARCALLLDAMLEERDSLSFSAQSSVASIQLIATKLEDDLTWLWPFDRPSPWPTEEAEERSLEW